MAANLDPNNNPNNNTSTGVGGAPTSSGAPTSAGAPVGVGAPQGGNIASSGGVQQSFLNPSGPAPQANNSGNFTNIQSYLNANQGAGQNIAGAIGQNANNQANTVANTTGNAQGVIGGQIAQENANIAQAGGIVNQIGQDPTQLFGGYNAGTNSFNNAQQFGNFQQLQNGTTNAAALTGAANQALQPAQADVNNLNTFANQAGSEQGRFGLLQQTLGNAGYNSGQQGLDQLLLSTAPGNNLGNLQTNLNNTATGAANNLANTQQQFASQIGALTPAAQAAQAQIAAAIGTTAAPTSGAAGTAYTPNATGAYGTGAFGALQTNLVNALNKQQGTANTDYSNLISALNNGGLNAQQFQDLNQALGGNLNANSQLFGGMTGASLDPAFAAQQYNINQVATAPQYTQYQALQALAGAPGTGPSIGGLTGPAAAPTNDISVNTNMFAPQYGTNTTGYNNATSGWQNLANNFGPAQQDQQAKIAADQAASKDITQQVNQAGYDPSNPAFANYNNLVGQQTGINNQLLADTNVGNLYQTQAGLAAQGLANAQKAAGSTGSIMSLLSPEVQAQLQAANAGGNVGPVSQDQLEAQVTNLLGAGAGQYVAPSGGGGGLFGGGGLSNITKQILPAATINFPQLSKQLQS